MWNQSRHLFKNCATKYNSRSVLFHTNKSSKLVLNTLNKYSVYFNNKNISTHVTVCNRTENDFKCKLDNNSAETDCNSFTIRTHNCGELGLQHVGLKVTLCGWVQFSRLSKFLLLRDAYGLTQCMITNDEIDLSKIPLETVVRIDGTVSSRPEDMINKTLSTGEIEVNIENLQVLNEVDKLPFNLRNYQKPKEQLRMQYRYLDLRFPEMQNILRQRSQMLHHMRRVLVESYGFVEVETPTLFCRTPGGAREFIVPTHNSGLFYSLVQSPQQFKQMLMAGGIDRYFQVARCYRDETTRPDRQPEFTQLDIELSFSNLECVLSMIEQLLHQSYLMPLPKPPFKRMTYKEALESYGTDKPNISYELKLQNLTQMFPEKESYGVFALPYPSEIGKLTSKYKEKIQVISKKYNTKILLNEHIPTKLGSEMTENIQKIIGQNNMIMSMGEYEDTCLSLGEVRELLAPLLHSKNLLHINDKIEPLWVVDFPLFTKREKGLETCHHPFTAPHPEDIHLLDTDPLKVRSLAYDLVMKGNEVGGGSVRVHNVQLQEKLLQLLNIDGSKLSHFLNALKSGCPPHAGIALGIDRLVSIACNAESIRDVIAFPKSHDGRDPLSGAPNVISEDDKKYYHITVTD